MKRFRSLFTAVAIILAYTATKAVNSGDDNIIDAIQRDSIVTIVQPQGLALRVKGQGHTVSDNERQKQPENQATTVGDPEQAASTENGAVAGTTKSAGYRVQVFSDNNVRTAKSEARSKAQSIQTRFPQYRTYVVYQSPYWRLKVGDFPTRTEAENVADEIKKVFPAFSREVRVVKDRINR